MFITVLGMRPEHDTTSLIVLILFHLKSASHTTSSLLSFVEGHILLQMILLENLTSIECCVHIDIPL